MYKLRSDIDINSLIDGRTILYLSKKIPYNRMSLANVLKGKQACSYERANNIVKTCRPDKKVTDYFIKVGKGS